MVIPTWLNRHAIALLGSWLQRAQARGWIQFDYRDGMVVWPQEVAAAFHQWSRDLIAIDLDQNAMGSRQVPTVSDLRLQLESDLEEGVVGDDPLALRWYDLRSRLKLESSELQMLAFLVALNRDLGLCRAFRFAWADVSRFAPAWGFITDLLSDNPADRHTIAARLSPARSPLFTSGLVDLVQGRTNAPMAEWDVVLCQEAVHQLYDGSHLYTPCIAPQDSIATPERLKSLLAARMGELARHQRRFLVVGPRGSGAQTLALHMARSLAPNATHVLFDLGQGGDADRMKRAQKALHSAVLWGGALVVTGIDDMATHRANIETLHGWLEPLPNLPVVWVSEEQPRAWFPVSPAGRLTVGLPGVHDREVAWREGLGGQADARTTKLLGSRFLLAEGHIAASVEEARALHGPSPPLEALEEAARRRASLGLGRLATVETGLASLADLVVDEDTALTLESIVAFARHRTQLHEAWGFGGVLSYGLGLTGLFAGPPGTGKTFAARAIANALGLELYRVDVSQLVSKYIGETEKHLAQLFDAAEASEVMLLFDEADSLFGKRTEVKSANDRYANLEVNYLLQRMERFDGITLLTTNFESGIDEAFSRRIRFRVYFDIPNAEARALLWQRLTPSAVPLTSDVDIKALARSFELSGGHIKESVLRAASVALQRGQSVDQEVLWQAANAEYKKLGRLPVMRRTRS